VQQISVRLKGRASQRYEITIGPQMLGDKLGVIARRALTLGARRAVIISNETVFSLYGERALASLRAADFATSHWLMKDGERYKNLRSLTGALKSLAESKLERSDCVIALGGGVVGDLAGLAAALFLRGIALVQVPTTLLAQVDASVGGKTAVNTPQGKNTIGAFHQPRAVVIDTETLQTLRRRELTGGWCECVKHGACGDRKLFDQTFRFLSLRAQERHNESAAHEMADLIAAHCRFKAAIVAGDEREDLTRMDYRSRRILNFGHTIAHALESVTNYRRFRHGEAVGYGMLVAGEISLGLAMLSASELELLCRAVRLCGRLPRADDLDIDSIIKTLAHDKKSVGGSLKWVLLERIGRARIVEHRDIRPRLLRASLRAALQKKNHIS
jgi:3-dehydroquinate synthase